MGKESVNLPEGPHEAREGVGVDSGTDANRFAETLASLKERTPHFKALMQLVLRGGGFSVKVDPEAESFKFDIETSTIHLSPKLAMSFENHQQGNYVAAHEVGHFLQYILDNDGYMKVFDTIKKRAGERASDGQLRGHREQLEKVYKYFFNLFLDIDVNRRHEAQLLVDQSKVRQSLYDKLFPDDLSDAPISMQWLQYLLTTAMGRPKNRLVFDPRLNEYIKREVLIGGAAMTVEEIVSQLGPPLDFTSSLFLIHSLLPVFDELLTVDAQEKRLGPLQEGDPIHEYQKATGDALGDEFRRAAEQFKEGVENENRSPMQKANDAAKNRLADQLQRQGAVGKQVNDTIAAIEASGDMFRHLSELWRRFFTILTTQHVETELGFRSGQFNVREFIRSLPRVLQGSPTPSFERRIIHEKNEVLPVKINLVLLLDLSDSMKEPERDMLQQCVFAIAKSLIQFKRKLKIEDGELANQFAFNVRIIGYGSQVLDPFILDGQNVGEAIDKELLRALIQVRQVAMNNTLEAQPLDEAIKIVEEVNKRVDQTGVPEVTVCLLITDGIANDYPSVPERLDNDVFKHPNTFLRGIIIKEINEAFNQNWISRGIGQYLPHFSGLKKVLEEILFDTILGEKA